MEPRGVARGSTRFGSDPVRAGGVGSYVTAARRSIAAAACADARLYLGETSHFVDLFRRAHSLMKASLT